MRDALYLTEFAGFGDTIPRLASGVGVCVWRPVCQLPAASLRASASVCNLLQLQLQLQLQLSS
jgi:hypothetical protein